MTYLDRPPADQPTIPTAVSDLCNDDRHDDCHSRSCECGCHPLFSLVGRPVDDYAARLDALYLTVTCPTCKAPAGTSCTIRRKAHPDRTAHLARQDKAVRADRRRQEKEAPGDVA